MINSISTKLSYTQFTYLVPSMTRRSSLLTTVRHNSFESFAKKMFENLIGYQSMSPKEISEAKILHQKLWVVHASIENHTQAHEHHEIAYSLQLFDNPKNFDIQKHYVKILGKEKISREEVSELLELYQLGLSQNRFSFAAPEIAKKVKECETLLSSNQKLFPNTLVPSKIWSFYNKKN